MDVVAFADYLLEEVEMYVHGLCRFGVQALPVSGTDVGAATVVIRNRRCDAVVTRILPAQFGIRLIRALNATPTTAHLPVVVIVSYPLPQLLDEARRAGATEVLLLPQTPEQLAHVVRRAIRQEPAA